MILEAKQNADTLLARVSTYGAELVSLGRMTADGLFKNVIWTPDKRYWNRTDPTLFPTIGRSANDSIEHLGISYPMPKHGLTNNIDWSGSVEDIDSGTRVVMETSDTESTRQHFPFPFTVRKTFSLAGNKLQIAWDVYSDVDMPFMMGGHPAFALPDFNADDEVHGYLQFKADMSKECATENMQNADDMSHNTNVLMSNVVLPDGFLHRETETIVLEQGDILPLTNKTFACDTLLDTRGLFTEITLLDKVQRPVATLRHDMPVLAIWAPNDGCAPFVCIEPWCGCCEDTPAASQHFVERRFIQTCKAGTTWHRHYTIEVH